MFPNIKLTPFILGAVIPNVSVEKNTIIMNNNNNNKITTNREVVIKVQDVYLIIYVVIIFCAMSDSNAIHLSWNSAGK